MSEVVFLRLTTGEELVCKHNSKKNTYKKIAVLVAQGQNSLGIMPWLPYVKGTNDETGVEIREENIIFRSEPAEDMVNEYNKIFGSGIITPNFVEQQEILNG